MKKIFIFLSTMLLSVVFMNAQDKLAFHIFPTNTGNFEIWYSTWKAPASRAVVVDWGDGNKIVYNTAYPNGAHPKGKIKGSVTKGKAISVYSTCLDAIYIVSSMDWITPYAENIDNLQYFYYLKHNLSSYALESFYTGLNDRSGKAAGELHLIRNVTTPNSVGNYSAMANADGFVALDKKWYITSNKDWLGGNWSDRAHWDVSTDAQMQSLLTHAAMMSVDAGQQLSVGVMDIAGVSYSRFYPPVTIINGDGKRTTTQRVKWQSSETSFSNTGKVSVTTTKGQQKIYGASVTHISCNNAFFNQIYTNNIRYLYLNQCKQTNEPPHLFNQTKLKLLAMPRSATLYDLNLSKNTNLEVLNLEHCSKLKTLTVGSTKLKELNLAFTPLLPMSQHPDYSKLTALKTLRINNCKLSACDLDAIYSKLPKKTSTHYVKVSNMSTSDDANDYKGANHTIATAKKWQPYGADEGGNSENYSYNGGGCATKYDIWVAGIQVTSANASNITGTGITDGKVSYNASSHTITLNNVRITLKGSSNYHGIETRDKSSENLKIKLVGKNIINNTFGMGFYLRKSTNFTGTGSLFVYCGGGQGVLINENKTLTFEGGCDVSIESAANAGIRGWNGSKLVVNNATLKATGGSASYSIGGGFSSLTMIGVKIFSPKGATFSSSLGGVALNGSLVKGQCVEIRKSGTDLENLTSQGIKVYGTKSEIHISIVTDEHKYASIYNLSGALVKVAELEGIETTVSGMQPGVYIVRIGNGAEKVIVR